jgi:hypothetical protein
MAYNFDDSTKLSKYFFILDWPIASKPFQVYFKTVHKEGTHKGQLETTWNWADAKSSPYRELIAKAYCGKGFTAIKLMGDNAELEQEIWPKEWATEDYVAGLKFKAKSQPKKKAFDFSVQARYGLPKAHE